jgi:lysophospholipase L1-like esterase
LVAAGLPTGTALLNLGVSGATVRDVIDGQLPVALDRAPRWITIWPGPNDFRDGVPLETFAAQLDQLLTALRPTGGQRRTIAILNLPDLRTLPVFARAGSTDLDARVRAWNASIATAVARHADYAILVDLHAGWEELGAHPEYISADGFHPSSAGYRRIADLTLATLKSYDR